MSTVSTFGTFTMARLGIYAATKGLTVTGNNITNINTAGYTRQALNQQSLYVSGADHYASSYDQRIGNGALVRSITQLRDPYLDIRYRNENTNVGAADAKLAGLDDIASVLDEVGKGDGDGVLEAQLNDMITQLENLTTQGAGQEEYDTLLRSSTSSLCAIFNLYSNKLETLRENEAVYLQEEVDTVNTILTSIQELNAQIRKASIHGSDALEERDSRNNLIDELSNYMDIKVQYVNEDLGGFTVEKLVISLEGADDMEAGDTDYADRVAANNAVLIDGVYATQLSIRQVPTTDGEGQLVAVDQNGNEVTFAPLSNLENAFIDENGDLVTLTELPQEVAMDSCVDADGKLQWYTGASTDPLYASLAEGGPYYYDDKGNVYTYDENGVLMDVAAQVGSETIPAGLDTYADSPFHRLSGEILCKNADEEYSIFEKLSSDASTVRAIDTAGELYILRRNDSYVADDGKSRKYYVPEGGSGIVTLSEVATGAVTVEGGGSTVTLGAYTDAKTTLRVSGTRTVYTDGTSNYIEENGYLLEVQQAGDSWVCKENPDYHRSLIVYTPDSGSTNYVVDDNQVYKLQEDGYPEDEPTFLALTSGTYYMNATDTDDDSVYCMDDGVLKKVSAVKNDTTHELEASMTSAGEDGFAEVTLGVTQAILMSDDGTPTLVNLTSLSWENEAGEPIEYAVGADGTLYVLHQDAADSLPYIITDDGKTYQYNSSNGAFYETDEDGSVSTDPSVEFAYLNNNGKKYYVYDGKLVYTTNISSDTSLSSVPLHGVVATAGGTREASVLSQSESALTSLSDLGTVYTDRAGNLYSVEDDGDVVNLSAQAQDLQPTLTYTTSMVTSSNYDIDLAPLLDRNGNAKMLSYDRSTIGTGTLNGESGTVSITIPGEDVPGLDVESYYTVDELKEALAGISNVVSRENGEVTIATYSLVSDKDMNGNITGYSIQKILTGYSDVTELYDNTLYGALQSERELLTEAGEFCTDEQLVYDANSATKRGYPYYQNALDALAQKFAEIVNGVNDDAANSTLENPIVIDGYVFATDGAGSFDVPSSGGCTLDEEDLVIQYDEEGNPYLTDLQKLHLLPEGTEFTVSEKFEEAGVTYEAGETYEAQGHDDGNIQEVRGGVLISNSGNSNDPTGITAGNISVSLDWSTGDVRVVNSWTSEGSTANENLVHFLTLMTSDDTHEFRPSDIGVNAASDSPYYTGTYQGMLTNIWNVMAQDQSVTSSMLDNYNTSLDELYTDRDSISGVDLNDETMNLMQYQKAYQAACRLMTTIDEMLDKLINGTGKAGL